MDLRQTIHDGHPVDLLVVGALDVAAAREEGRSLDRGRAQVGEGGDRDDGRDAVILTIGAADLVRARAFPAKWGATFGTGDGTFERFADFSVAPEVRTPQTWQVPRAEFDELLLRHAASCGADVREEHRVLDAAFDPAGVTVTFRDSADSAREVRVAAVVDASGRFGLLARKFGLRVDEPRLANIAVFSHYSSVPRADGRRAGDIRVIARADLGYAREPAHVGRVVTNRIRNALYECIERTLGLEAVR
jgi:hypothetical protein